MSDFSKKLERLQTLQNEVKQAYKEINALKKDIIKHMVEIEKTKVVEISETHKATLVWTVEKNIDYERLATLYPDVYELGLRPQFSTAQALNSVSKELLTKIINDCITESQQYNLKVRRKNAKI